MACCVFGEDVEVEAFLGSLGGALRTNEIVESRKLQKQRGFSESLKASTSGFSGNILEAYHRSRALPKYCCQLQASRHLCEENNIKEFQRTR